MNTISNLGLRIQKNIYNEISSAMKQSRIIWTEKHLFAYLKSPTKYIPGIISSEIRVNFEEIKNCIGIESEADRANIIAYLKNPVSYDSYIECKCS